MGNSVKVDSVKPKLTRLYNILINYIVYTCIYIYMSVYVYVDILYSLSVVKQIILLKININRVLDGRHAWTGR